MGITKIDCSKIHNIYYFDKSGVRDPKIQTKKNAFVGPCSSFFASGQNSHSRGVKRRHFDFRTAEPSVVEHVNETETEVSVFTQTCFFEPSVPHSTNNSLISELETLGAQSQEDMKDLEFITKQHNMQYFKQFKNIEQSLYHQSVNGYPSPKFDSLLEEMELRHKAWVQKDTG